MLTATHLLVKFYMVKHGLVYMCFSLEDVVVVAVVLIIFSFMRTEFKLEVYKILSPFFTPCF